MSTRRRCALSPRPSPNCASASTRSSPTFPNFPMPRDFGKEVQLLSLVSDIMRQAHAVLLRPDTGPEAIAFETEVIELLLQSKRQQSGGGGGGGGGSSNSGGGNNGGGKGSARATSAPRTAPTRTRPPWTGPSSNPPERPAASCRRIPPRPRLLFQQTRNELIQAFMRPISRDFFPAPHHGPLAAQNQVLEPDPFKVVGEKAGDEAADDGDAAPPVQRNRRLPRRRRNRNRSPRRFPPTSSSSPKPSGTTG